MRKNREPCSTRDVVAFRLGEPVADRAHGGAERKSYPGQWQPIIVLHGGPDFDHGYLLPDLDRWADAFRLLVAS